MSKIQCCQNPAEHVKFLRFCEVCAQRHDSVSSELIICGKCNKQMHGKHSRSCQTGYKLLSSQENRRKIEGFVQGIRLLDLPDCSLTIQIKQIDVSNPGYISLFQFQEFRNYMISMRFWEFSDENKKPKAIDRVKSIIKQISSKDLPTESREPDRMSRNQDCIEALQLNNIDQCIRNMHQLISIAKKEQKLLDFLIKNVFSAVSGKERKSAICMLEIEIEKKQNEQSQNEQSQKETLNKLLLMLYLCKLHCMDLHKDNYQSAEQILALSRAVDPQIKHKGSYYFYQSYQYWRKVSKQEISAEAIKMYACDVQLKDYYVIDKPAEYVECLNQIISLKQGRTGFYYACRGLGKLFQGQYSQSIQDFLKAMSLDYQSDSMKSNMNYVRHYQLNDAQAQTDMLAAISQTNSPELLTNTLKYLKSKHLHKQMIECCSQLIKLRPKNQFARLYLIKTLLKMDKVEEAKQQLEQLRKVNSRFVEDNSLKLIRQFHYATARIAKRKKKEDKALKCIQLNLHAHSSASSNYSYASVLFEQQKYEDAVPYIAAARQRSPDNKKYILLDFYNTLLRREIEQAKTLLLHLDQKSVPFQIRELLQKL